METKVYLVYAYGSNDLEPLLVCKDIKEVENFLTPIANPPFSEGNAWRSKKWDGLIYNYMSIDTTLKNVT